MLRELTNTLRPDFCPLCGRVRVVTLLERSGSVADFHSTAPKVDSHNAEPAQREGTCWLVALAWVAAVGCGTGDPLELALPPGSYTAWNESTPTSRGNAEEPQLESSQAPEPSTVLSPVDLDPLVPDDFQSFLERPASGVLGASTLGSPSLCYTDTEFCGGSLEGNWFVDESCDANRQDPELLWDLAQELVQVRGAVCATAPRWLVTTWSGDITFQSNLAQDNREEHTTLRVVLGPECLTATFDAERTMQTTADNCALLNNEFTVCSAEPGRCVCTSQSFRSGQGSGIYRYLEEEDTVEVANQSQRQTIPYHYCVEDDQRMVWWEPDTGDRVVLRRKGTEQLLLGLPSEVAVRPVP